VCVCLCVCVCVCVCYTKETNLHEYVNIMFN
jgi:hypothetical protein